MSYLDVAIAAALVAGLNAPTQPRDVPAGPVPAAPSNPPSPATLATSDAAERQSPKVAEYANP
jgi:hypothetical protein